MTTRPSSQTDSRIWCLSPLPQHSIKQIGVKRECGYEKWQVWVYTWFNLLWMKWPWFCRWSWNAKFGCVRSHSLRRQLALTPGSKMFDGPKKFLCSPIRFNEHKSCDQASLRRHRGSSTWGIDLHQNRSNSTLAPFERMMHRQTNIRCSFKRAEQWNGRWSQFAKCEVKERIGNNGRR